MHSNTKVRKTINYTFKLLILLITWWFVYDQMANEKNMGQVFLKVMDSFGEQRKILIFCIAVFLMFVNWSFEVFKWKYLLRQLEDVSFWKAYKSVLAGISIGSITPNRLGDYLGRVFFLEGENRISGVFASVLGSMAQLTTTVIMGCLGLLVFFEKHFFALFPDYQSWHFIFTPLIVAIGGITLFCYFGLGQLYSKGKGWLERRWPTAASHLEALSHYSSHELLLVLLLSISRYLVFTFQLYLFLQLFGLTLSYLEAMGVICVLYLFLSFIPSVALSEIGVRGSVSLFLFGLYFGGELGFTAEHKVAVVGASSLLWALNLGIPALLGSMMIFYKKRLEKKEKF
ncbi:MAG: lysylphosphatidylglycerol synthase domain-containing protein [Bacteroidales bacterium]